MSPWDPFLSLFIHCTLLAELGSDYAYLGIISLDLALLLSESDNLDLSGCVEQSSRRPITSIDPR